MSHVNVYSPIPKYLPPRYNGNIVESGFKHHNQNMSLWLLIFKKSFDQFKYNSFSGLLIDWKIMKATWKEFCFCFVVLFCLFVCLYLFYFFWVCAFCHFGSFCLFVLFFMWVWVCGGVWECCLATYIICYICVNGFIY